MSTLTDQHLAAVALAGLSVVESILIDLTERNILEETDLRGILDDAMAAHREAATQADAPDMRQHHDQAVALIRRIRTGRNWMHGLTPASDRIPPGNEPE